MGCVRGSLIVFWWCLVEMAGEGFRREKSSADGDLDALRQALNQHLDALKMLTSIPIMSSLVRGQGTMKEARRRFGPFSFVPLVNLFHLLSIASG